MSAPSWDKPGQIPFFSLSSNLLLAIVRAYQEWDRGHVSKPVDSLGRRVTVTFCKRKNGRKDTADRRVKANNETAPGGLARHESLASVNFQGQPTKSEPRQWGPGNRHTSKHTSEPAPPSWRLPLP